MESIASLDDPRIAPYCNLRERTLRGEAVFIAEGRLVVDRLLASPYPTESVLATPEMAELYADRLPESVPLYVAADHLLRMIAGFPFHRGVLALGRRLPPRTLETLMEGAGREEPVHLLVGPELNQPENLGLIFRTAGGLGMNGVILGPQSCDPLSRRTLRVSMGGVLYVPWFQSADLDADLCALRRRWGVELVASVLDERATPLPAFPWPRRCGLMLGNEYQGLTPPWLAQADHLVTIPMCAGTDSLNVGVAAGILMYDLRRRSAP